MTKKSQIAQSSLTLMLVITVAKLIGMLRDVVLANYFGTTNVSDAYLIAVSIPSYLFFFIGHSLSTAYLPMYNKIRHEQGEEKAQRYTNALISLAMVISTVIVAVLLLFPEVLVRIFAAGFDDATLKLTSKFVRISAVSLYFMTVINVWGGYLHAKDNYLVPASISLPRNAMIMISIVLAATFHVNFLGVGLLCAYIAEFLLLLPFVLKKGFKPRFSLEYKTPEIKETMYLVLPILLGVAVGQINKIIDRSVASTVVDGGISALTYACILNNAVQEILVTGIITILFAKCASWVAEGKHKLVKKKLSQTVNTMVFLLVPASCGIIACGRLIVKCILCRGEFDERSLQLTTGSLCCYTVGLLFLALRDTFVKVCYAYKNTKVTTISSTIAIAVNIVLNLILSRFLGINGLALATSISAVVNFFILYVYLHKKLRGFGLGQSLVVLLQTSLASAGMFVSIWWIQPKLLQTGMGELLVLFLCVGIGVLVYGVLSLLFHNRVPLGWVRTVLNRLKKKPTANS